MQICVQLLLLKQIFIADTLNIIIVFMCFPKITHRDELTFQALPLLHRNYSMMCCHYSSISTTSQCCVKSEEKSVSSSSVLPFY